MCFLITLQNKDSIFILLLKDAESKDQSTSISWLSLSRKFKGRTDGVIWVHWPLDHCFFYYHLSSSNGFILISGTKNLKWENDIALTYNVNKILWLIESYCKHCERYEAQYSKISLKLQYLIFCSANDVLLVIHCCQNEQLQRNHQPSGKAFLPTWIHWFYARLFAPSVGYESVEGWRLDSWSCQLWNATY